MIDVLLVDDHDLVRTGIKSLLANEVGIRVIGEAATGEDALKAVRDLAPTIVLMDVSMPGIGGLEATKKILRSNPEVRVIVLTAHNAEPFPSRLLQAGAAGYLTKDAGTTEMIEAIRSVASGKRYISPNIAQQLALRSLGGKDESPFDKLSERELQVMLMITNGCKVQEISDKLHLSPKTVNSYRYRLFEKLKVNSDVELTHLAIRHNMIDQADIA